MEVGDRRKRRRINSDWSRSSYLESPLSLSSGLIQASTPGAQSSAAQPYLFGSPQPSTGVEQPVLGHHHHSASLPSTGVGVGHHAYGYGLGSGAQPLTQPFMSSNWPFDANAQYGQYNQANNPQFNFSQYSTSPPYMPNTESQATGAFGSFLSGHQAHLYGPGPVVDTSIRQSINRPSAQSPVEYASPQSQILARQQQQHQQSQSPYSSPFSFSAQPSAGGPTSHPVQMSHGPSIPAAQEEENPPDLLEQYEHLLEAAIQLAQNYSLEPAAHNLLQATEKLLRNAKELCLYQDLPEEHAEPRPNWRRIRLELFDNFNNTWKDLLARQHDMLREEASTRQKPQGSQTRIHRDLLERMGEELTKYLNPDLESFGLADSGQVGVQHDEIISLILRCRKLVLELDGRFEQTPDFVMERLPPATASASTAAAK